MATTSFTKNYYLPNIKSAKFIEIMAKEQYDNIVLDNFESHYSHPAQYKDELKRIFGK